MENTTTVTGQTGTSTDYEHYYDIVRGRGIRRPNRVSSRPSRHEITEGRTVRRSALRAASSRWEA